MIKNIFERFPFLKHLILAGLFLIGIVFLTFFWLKFYTNHGQKLSMPEFVGMDLKKAKKLAGQKSFTIISEDSVFVVGEPGGIILSQNPKPDAEVKSGRKVYVSTTKYIADKILVENLPTLYGNDISQKQEELGYRGIKTKIRSRKYDSGEPNHILEVYYNNQLIIGKNVIKSKTEISKGDVLEFVISDKESGEGTIPNLICKSYAEAQGFLEMAKLRLGAVKKVEGFDENGPSYIVGQDPMYDGISKISFKVGIDVTIDNVLPIDCN